ncbi:MAG: hypothetical protein ACREKR_10360 [Candidatus Methylomirabilales bacterium]
MIPFLVYKNIHLVGVFMILMALGGLLLHSITGGTQEHSWRRPVAITHGVGLLLVLLGGFGMLARIGIYWPWPGWVTGKIIIWMLFGGLVGVIFRRPGLARSLWWVAIALAGLAAYLAGHKPF